MKKSGMELIAIAHYSLLFGASGKRHVATDNFLAISCWLLAIAISLNLVRFRIWCFTLAGRRGSIGNIISLIGRSVIIYILRCWIG